MMEDTPMTPTLKAALLATSMAAAALLPAAGLLTLVSADAAFAKGEGNGNGNGGNGGGGGGRGNGGQGSEARGAQKEAHGGGRPDWAGARGNGGNGGGRSDSARGGSDPISNFIRGLAGGEKREARAQARAATREARQAPTEFAPLTSVSPSGRPARHSDMHPSQLGNMNGALNADMNAVFAHIRNGNQNGPVGALAALAVADAGVRNADAQLLLNAEEVTALLGEYDSVEEYEEAVEGGADPIPELDEALAALEDDAAAREDALAAQRAAEESILARPRKSSLPIRAGLIPRSS
jgi:hypothetical protein